MFAVGRANRMLPTAELGNAESTPLTAPVDTADTTDPIAAVGIAETTEAIPAADAAESTEATAEDWAAETIAAAAEVGTAERIGAAADSRPPLPVRAAGAPEQAPPKPRATQTDAETSGRPAVTDTPRRLPPVEEAAGPMTPDSAETPRRPPLPPDELTAAAGG